MEGLLVRGAVVRGHHSGCHLREVLHCASFNRLRRTRDVVTFVTSLFVHSDVL